MSGPCRRRPPPPRPPAKDPAQFCPLLLPASLTPFMSPPRSTPSASHVTPTHVSGSASREPGRGQSACARPIPRPRPDLSTHPALCPALLDDRSGTVLRSHCLLVCRWFGQWLLEVRGGGERIGVFAPLLLPHLGPCACTRLCLPPALNPALNTESSPPSLLI